MDGDFARGVSYEISYGKLRVPLYRVYASPLSGVPPIPESAFTGRPNTLVGLEIDLEVFGESFLPAYTEGDNSRVVATDSMKNVILQQTLTYGGATMEGLLAHLGSYFLATYDDMERLRLTARELPFAPVQVPAQDHQRFTESAVPPRSAWSGESRVAWSSPTIAVGVAGWSCSKSRGARSPALCATPTPRCPSAATDRSSSR
jgi:hypothetical protein